MGLSRGLNFYVIYPQIKDNKKKPRFKIAAFLFMSINNRLFN